MENNEYFSTEVTEETKDWLILMGLNELPFFPFNNEKESVLIINKTQKQFWGNGKTSFSHASKMTPITPITFNEIKKWQTN